jgi:hypothetical protein
LALGQGAVRSLESNDDRAVAGSSYPVALVEAVQPAGDAVRWYVDQAAAARGRPSRRTAGTLHATDLDRPNGGLLLSTNPSGAHA